MSDQSAPPAQGDPNQPGPGAPPSGWMPTPLSDGSRPSFGPVAPPPRQPGSGLGGPALPQVTIEEYAPPKSRLPLLVALIAIVVAAAIWAGTTLRPAAAPEAAASPTASPAASASAPGLPFVVTDQNASGRWEIVSHRWTDSGLEAEIRIYADSGEAGYSFMAFGNNDVQATAPETSSQSPQFPNRTIASGDSATGWVFFALQRGPSTIMLYTAGGSQISALPVTG